MAIRTNAGAVIKYSVAQTLTLDMSLQDALMLHGTFASDI